MAITADTIRKLLAVRHSGDVFVPECKNGPTHYSMGLLKLDAWAMARSWVRPATYGYEIKVTRSDFLRDDKWQGYLRYCTDFYFAVAPGVCDPKELPDGVGLLIASANGARLFTKRKATRREVQIPEDIFRYVLMCRTKVMREHWSDDRETRLRFWREWIKEKRENRDLGYRVSKALSERYERDVTEVKSENATLKSQIERLETVSRICGELGIQVDKWSYFSEGNARNKLADRTAAIPSSLRSAIAHLVDNAKRIETMVARHDAKAPLDDELPPRLIRTKRDKRSAKP